jgi:hypothetical protein
MLLFCSKIFHFQNILYFVPYSRTKRKEVEILQENRYKKLREDYEFKEGGRRLTTRELAEIFQSEYGCYDFKEGYLRKIESKAGGRRLHTEELKAYCDFFNTTADYLLGFSDIPYKETNQTKLNDLGLCGDAIEMLKLFNDKTSRHYRLNQKSVEMLNIILSDFYKQVQAADDDEGIYFGNIFFSMYEYLNAANTVTLTADTENGGVKFLKKINVSVESIDVNNATAFSIIDNRSTALGHSVNLEDATKYRTQADIFKKLDELAEKNSERK